MDEEGSLPSSWEKVCRSCFGLLQFSDSERFTECVAKQVKEQDFQFEDFRFNFKTPLFIHLTRLKLWYESEGSASSSIAGNIDNVS